MIRKKLKSRWVFLLMLMFFYILAWGLKTLPAAADPGIALFLNGVQVKPAVPPYIDANGRTMVPLRFIMEYMGARVDWLEKERGIVVTRGSITLKMWIDSRQAYVNGQSLTLDTTPVLKGDTTMVPVRFVSQAFGGRVEWEEATQSVKITLGGSAGSQVRLTGSYVNIRSGPGLNYSIITTLPRDTVLSFLGEASGWYKVQLKDGRQGWVSASYAQLVGGPSDNGGPSAGGPSEGDTKPPAEDNRPPDGDQQTDGQPLGLAVIGSRPVAVLAGPSPVEKQVGTAAAGSRLPIWEQKGDWWQVEMDDGRRGWLARALATFAPYEPSEKEPNDSQDNLQITGVTVTTVGEAFKVTVKATGAFTFKTSRWDNRLIVDVPGAVLAVSSGQTTVEVNRPPLLRVRLGQYTKDTVRIVFDLNSSVRLRSQPAADQKGMIFLLEKSSVKGSKIVIDPGHGTDPEGRDPGAIGPTGVQEKDVNLAMAQKLAALLKQAGANVYLTRSDEICPYTLSGRAYYANDIGADLFISIHSNASLSPEASGTSTYFYAPEGTALGQQREERLRLATAIQNALVAVLGTKDLGVREANFAVLRNTDMPSVLVETAFISNPTEEQLLNNPTFQAKVAEGIFNGISAYFAGQ